MTKENVLMIQTSLKYAKINVLRQAFNVLLKRKYFWERFIRQKKIMLSEELLVCNLKKNMDA